MIDSRSTPEDRKQFALAVQNQSMSECRAIFKRLYPDWTDDSDQHPADAVIMAASILAMPLSGPAIKGIMDVHLSRWLTPSPMAKSK